MTTLPLLLLTFQTPDLQPVQSTRAKHEIRKPASRWKRAMYGAIAGFAIGFPIGASRAGYLADRNNPPLSLRLGFGTSIGGFSAGIGAGIGALTKGK